MMLSRVGVIFKKEILQVLRDSRARVLLFAPPLIQLIIFGYAVNLDVENSRVAWMDMDQSPASRELRSDFEASPYFTIVRSIDDESEVERALDRGEVVAVIRIPESFASDLIQGRKPAVQALLDGTNSNTAAIVANYIGRVVAVYSERKAGEQVAARLVGASLRQGGPIRKIGRAHV